MMNRSDIIQTFCDEVSSCLHEFNQTLFPLSSNFASNYITHENGSKKRGDFSINLISPQFSSIHNDETIFNSIGDRIISESEKFNSFRVIKFKALLNIKLIQLFIDRKTSVAKILSHFGLINPKQQVENNLKEKLIICECSFRCSSSSKQLSDELTSFRVKLISQSLCYLTGIDKTFHLDGRKDTQTKGERRRKFD